MPWLGDPAKPTAASPWPWDPPTIGAIDGRAPSCQDHLPARTPIQPGAPTNLEAAFGSNTTDHAIAHFRLLHPELMIDIPATLSDAVKAKPARCLPSTRNSPPGCLTTQVGVLDMLFPKLRAGKTSCPRSLNPAAGWTRPCTP